MPWFSTKGQILQLLVAAVALCFVMRPALQSMIASDYFSTGAIVFYLLVVSVLVSVGLLTGAIYRYGKPEQQIAGRLRRPWVALFLCGTIITVVLGVTLVVLYTLVQTQEQFAVFSSLSISRTPREDVPLQRWDRELVDVDYDLRVLQDVFLRIPHPCAIKVTAPSENKTFRQRVLMAASQAEIQYLNRPSERVITTCRVIEDAKDTDPDSYVDQLTFAPPGIVIVNTAASRNETAEFIVEKLKLCGFKARSGTTLPPDSPEGIIYFQVGTGQLH